MKKSFLLLAFLPALSFAGLKPADFMSIQQIRVYSFDSSGNLVNALFNVPTVDMVPSFFYSRPLAIISSGARLTHPNLISDVPTNGASSASIDTPIRATTVYNSSILWYSPFAFPEIANIYGTAWSLFSAGYRGPAFRVFHEATTSNAFNFVFTDLLSDVMSSTNTLYRQIVLSHLSSIQASVQNIELNVSGLQSSIDSGNNFLSSISNSLTSVNSNVLDVSTSLVGVLSNSQSSVSALNDISRFDRLRNWPVDNFSSWLDFMVDNGEVLPVDASFWLQSYNNLTDETSRASFAIGVSDRVNYADLSDIFISHLNSSSLGRAGSSFNEGVIDALIGDYSEGESKRGEKAVNVRTSIKSQLQAWRNEAKQQLNDWKADLKSDLQAWKTSDETGYLNIREAIDKNLSYSPPGSTNRLPFTSFQTNFVVKPLTNSIESSASDIQSNATSNVDRQIEDLQQRWNEFKSIATGNGDGLNVKIKFPLWESDSYHVNVRDDAVVEALQDGVTIVSPDLTHISDSWDSFLSAYSPTNSLDWEPWFEKWIPFADAVTNYYAEFNASVPSSGIAADFLERGFDADRYSSLPWFQRVEVLLAMIADVRTNPVEVADIQQDMEQQAEDFHSLSTNVVGISENVFGLFQYVQRFSSSLQSIFGDRAAPLSGDYVLLPAGSWIFDEPLTLRINPTIQNFCRLIMQCIWYLGFLVGLWVVVNWTWQKVVAVLRWLWSMFDV